MSAGIGELDFPLPSSYCCCFGETIQDRNNEIDFKPTYYVLLIIADKHYFYY